MSFVDVPLDAEQFEFSLPHALCLVGEEQYLLGAGGLFVASSLAVTVSVERRGGEFSIAFNGGGAEAELAGPQMEALRQRWDVALAEKAVVDPACLEGLCVRLRFDDELAACPPAVLVTSPAAAAALTVAALAAGFELESLTDIEVARRACDVLQAVRGSPQTSDRFYGPVLTTLAGGALHVEPGRQALNVQQLLPPESLLLALAEGVVPASQRAGNEDEAAHALRAAVERNRGVVERGDAGFEALFEIGKDILDDRQVTMVYGLLRVRQMTEEFLEHLGEPYVDNDRLAEICDEESMILRDYFGFPDRPFERARARAVAAGALGCKLTRVLGDWPAAVVLAPGRRDDVREALEAEFERVRFLPVDVDPAGLRWGGIELPDGED